jgi:hypothetical protein
MIHSHVDVGVMYHSHVGVGVTACQSACYLPHGLLWAIRLWIRLELLVAAAICATVCCAHATAGLDAARGC